MSEKVRGPFYTVPWMPGMQETQMPASVWVQLVTRAEQLRGLGASTRVLRQAITMRTTTGVLFGSPIDQLVAYLGMLASPGPRKTKGGPAEAERVAV